MTSKSIVLFRKSAYRVSKKKKKAHTSTLLEEAGLRRGGLEAMEEAFGDLDLGRAAGSEHGSSLPHDSRMRPGYEGRGSAWRRERGRGGGGHREERGADRQGAAWGERSWGEGNGQHRVQT